MSQTVRFANPKNIRKSKAPWLIWLLLAILATLWWSLYQSKWFVAENIVVTGNSRLATEQIIQAANVPIGNSLMSIDTLGLTSTLLTIPELKAVTVERGWPHTVLINVIERTPIAVAETGSGFNLIDSDGHGAGAVTTPPRGLLIISAQPDSPAMVGAISALAAIPPEWKLVGLAALTQDSIVATLRSGAVITFGSGDRAADKVEVAQALIEKGYSVINVSAPDAATVLK